MTHDRLVKPNLLRCATVLIGLGIFIVLLGAPRASQADDLSWIWLPLAGLLLYGVGALATVRAMPKPLAPIPTPPGWPWFFTLLIVFPLLAGFLPLNTPGVVVTAILAAALAVWAALWPGHRLRVVAQQYEDEQARAAQH